MILYVICRWDEIFETAETRRTVHTPRIAAPTSTIDFDFAAVRGARGGWETLGIWEALRRTMGERHMDQRNGRFEVQGRPMSIGAIAAAIGAPASKTRRALDLLVKVGWMAAIDVGAESAAAAAGERPGVAQGDAQGPTMGRAQGDAQGHAHGPALGRPHASCARVGESSLNSGSSSPSQTPKKEERVPESGARAGESRATPSTTARVVEEPEVFTGKNSLPPTVTRPVVSAAPSAIEAVIQEWKEVSEKETGTAAVIGDPGASRATASLLAAAVPDSERRRAAMGAFWRDPAQRKRGPLLHFFVQDVDRWLRRGPPTRSGAPPAANPPDLKYPCPICDELIPAPLFERHKDDHRQARVLEHRRSSDVDADGVAKNGAVRSLLGSLGGKMSAQGGAN